MTIFRELEVIFANSHRGWCCDSCAFQRGMDPNTVAPGITLQSSVSDLRRYPSTNKIVTLGKSQAFVPRDPNEPQRDTISSERKVELQAKLTRWRIAKLKESGLPKYIQPSIILPDQLLSPITSQIRNIVTFDQLLRTLRRELEFRVQHALRSRLAHSPQTD